MVRPLLGHRTASFPGPPIRGEHQPVVKGVKIHRKKYNWIQLVNIQIHIHCPQKWPEWCRKLQYIMHASDGKRFVKSISKALTPRSCMFFIHLPSAQGYYQPSCLDTAPFLSHHHQLKTRRKPSHHEPKESSLANWKVVYTTKGDTLPNSLPPTPSRLTRVPVRRFFTGRVHGSCAHLHWVKKERVI